MKMTERILLINPGERTEYMMPPMGLMAIASAVLQEGHQAQILDLPALDINYNDIVHISARYKVIGITAMNTNIREAIKLADALKIDMPWAKILLGGPFPTLLPEETLKASNGIDILVRGEGENTIKELMAVLGKEHYDLSKIRGISYRQNGAIIHNPDRIQSQRDYYDLDRHLITPYQLLPKITEYRPHPPRGRYPPFFMLVTSRGCPYWCKFCAKPVFGSIYRSQSPQHIATEIDLLKELYGAREIAFFDDIFVLNRNKVLELCALLKDKDIHWTCEARVDLVEARELKAMKEAGCYAIAFGIESSSPYTLQRLGKSIRPEQSVEAVKMAHEAGMEVLGYMMIGSPGEDEYSILKTIQFAKDLELDYVQFAVTTAYPGTEMYDEYLAKYPDPKPTWDKFLYDNNSLAPVFETEYLSRQRLNELADKANRQFYFRPGYAFKRLKKIKSWQDVKVYLDGARMLIRNLVFHKSIDKFKVEK